MRGTARRWAAYFGLADPPPEDAPFARGETLVGVLVRMFPPTAAAIAVGEALGFDSSAPDVLGYLGLALCFTLVWVFVLNAALGYWRARRQGTRT